MQLLSFMATKLIFLTIMCMVLGAITPAAEATVSCGQVVNNLTPCISYVVYGGSIVPEQCCNGIRNLNGMAQNTPDRQNVCNCIKNTVSSSGFTFSNFNLNLAAGLPQKCGVNIPYQISPNTDCSRVR